MVRYISLLLYLGLAWGQVDKSDAEEGIKNQAIVEEKSILNKHNLSIGMLDDRTGLSLIGYTSVSYTHLTLPTILLV